MILVSSLDMTVAYEKIDFRIAEMPILLFQSSLNIFQPFQNSTSVFYKLWGGGISDF